MHYKYINVFKTPFTLIPLFLDEVAYRPFRISSTFLGILHSDFADDIASSHPERMVIAQGQTKHE